MLLKVEWKGRGGTGNRDSSKPAHISRMLQSHSLHWALERGKVVCRVANQNMREEGQEFFHLKVSLGF